STLVSLNAVARHDSFLSTWLDFYSGCLLPSFFRVPAPRDIYTLSLHDALPICSRGRPSRRGAMALPEGATAGLRDRESPGAVPRSEEHTSELQSRENLVCRLLLEKKKTYGR